MKVTQFFALFLLISLLACRSTYTLPQTTRTDLTKSSLRRYKIALVGFYPFYTTSERSGDITTTTARLDYDRSLKDLSQLGKPVEEYPVTGRVRISKDSMVEKLKPYLTRVRRSGIDEMEKLFDLGSDEKTIYFNKRDVDYYLVGVFGPPFGRCSENLLGLFSLMTLGVIPFSQSCQSETTVLIMDSDFNQVGQVTSQSESSSIGSWWFFWLDLPKNGGESYDSKQMDRILYESDVAKVEAELDRLGIKGYPATESE